MNNRRTNLIEFFFPKTCINCKMLGEYLCNNCKSLLKPHPEICPYCHKFSQDYQTCLDCKINHHHALEGVIIPFAYDELIKKLILKLKYYHQKDVADFLTDRLTIALQINKKIGIQKENLTLNIQNTILLSYIPSHRYRKHFIKGYNQSEILAQTLSEKMGAYFVPLLEKPQATKSQVKLQRDQRFINLQGKFIKNPEIQLQGNETIILVDDITTTSSTLNEAALAIKKYCPQTKVRGLVLARHC